MKSQVTGTLREKLLEFVEHVSYAFLNTVGAAGARYLLFKHGKPKQKMGRFGVKKLISNLIDIFRGHHQDSELHFKDDIFTKVVTVVQSLNIEMNVPVIVLGNNTSAILGLPTSRTTTDK